MLEIFSGSTSSVWFWTVPATRVRACQGIPSEGRVNENVWPGMSDDALWPTRSAHLVVVAMDGEPHRALRILQGKRILSSMAGFIENTQIRLVI